MTEDSGELIGDDGGERMSDELENDVISRKEAVAALDKWLEGQPDNSSFGIKSDTIDCAIAILNYSLRARPQDSYKPCEPCLREDHDNCTGDCLSMCCALAAAEAELEELRRARPQEPGDLISRETAVKELERLQHGWTTQVDEDQELFRAGRDALRAARETIFNLAPPGPQEPRECPTDHTYSRPRKGSVANLPTTANFVRTRYSTPFCPDCGANLSAPSGPLSDPEGDLISREAVVTALHHRDLVVHDDEDGKDTHFDFVYINSATAVINSLPSSSGPLSDPEVKGADNVDS